MSASQSALVASKSLIHYSPVIMYSIISCYSSPASQLPSSPSNLLKFSAIALTTSPAARGGMHRCSLTTLLAPLTPAGACSPAPFIFSKASTPIPAKLVAKIQALHFIDTRELLPDNIALMERLEAFPPHVGQVPR